MTRQRANPTGSAWVTTSGRSVGRRCVPPVRPTTVLRPVRRPWGERCAIKLLKAPKSEASFYDFDEFERLVKAAQSDPLALQLVLLGGEASLRCGEMMALEMVRRGPGQAADDGGAV